MLSSKYWYRQHWIWQRLGSISSPYLLGNGVQISLFFPNEDSLGVTMTWGTVHTSVVNKLVSEFCISTVKNQMLRQVIWEIEQLSPGKHFLYLRQWKSSLYQRIREEKWKTLENLWCSCFCPPELTVLRIARYIFICITFYLAYMTNVIDVNMLTCIWLQLTLITLKWLIISC